MNNDENENGDETAYSILLWEDISNLPFPKEVRAITKAIKWDEFEWHVIGLPEENAKYSMVGGKTLYLNEMPDGDIKIEKCTDFTGNIFVGGYFVDEDVDGNNYLLAFRVTIVKGELLEIAVDRLNKQSSKEYKDALNDFQNRMNHMKKVSESFWFKYLYRPWYLLVRGISFSVLFILKTIKDVVVWITNHLTPL